MKKIICYIITLLLVMSLIPMTAYADMESGCVKIFDEADYFSNSDEQEIVNYINDLYYSEIGMDVIVWTNALSEYDFDSMSDYQFEQTLQELTDDFYDTHTANKDGILILVSDEAFTINTVGYAVTAINDYEVEDTIDAGWDDYYDYKYLSCVKKTAKYASGLIQIAYENAYTDDKIETEINPPIPEPETLGGKIGKAIIPTFMSLIVSVIITAITLGGLVIKHKTTSKKINAKQYLGESYKVSDKRETYKGTRETVSKNYYKPSSSSSSSSRSGRSGSSSSHRSGSSHRSSGGRSHGGGSRRR